MAGGSKTKVGVGVTVSGPLFQPSTKSVKVHPSWTQRVRELEVTTSRKLADIILMRLRVMATIRPQGVYLSPAQGGKSTGFYRQNLSIRRENRQHVVHDRGVIYGPWLEGTSFRNQTTRFKGYGMFRRAKQFAQKKARNVARGEAARITARMGGVPDRFFD